MHDTLRVRIVDGSTTYRPTRLVPGAHPQLAGAVSVEHGAQREPHLVVEVGRAGLCTS